MPGCTAKTTRSFLKGIILPVAVYFAGLSLSGCHSEYRVEYAARPEVNPWAQRPNLATICILRPQTFGALATFLHFDNGRFVGVTRGARVFFCYLAQPGLHRLVARSDNDAELKLEAAAGGRYFVRLEVRFGPDGLTLVGEGYARRWVGRLRYVVTHPDRKGAILPYRLPVPALSSAGGEVTAAKF